MICIVQTLRDYFRDLSALICDNLSFLICPRCYFGLDLGMCRHKSIQIWVKTVHKLQLQRREWLESFRALIQQEVVAAGARSALFPKLVLLLLFWGGAIYLLNSVFTLWHIYVKRQATEIHAPSWRIAVNSVMHCAIKQNTHFAL